ITKFIAMSVKAEMLVTAASPLFNGNPDYAGFKDQDGQLLFPQQYDVQKWEKAVIATREAIEECENIGLSLYTQVPTSSVGNVSDELKQILSFHNIIPQRWEENPELIWGLNFSFNYQGFTLPKLTED